MKYFFKRTIAYIIDCAFAYSIVMLLIQWLIFGQIREMIGITEEWFKSSLNMELYVLVSISIPVWTYFALMDSKVTKGTLGKRLMKLSVSKNERFERISIRESFLRTFFKLLPWEIAHLGVIFPTPMYFDNEPEIRILTIFGILLFIIYVFSTMISNKGQAVYDILLGTKVIVNKDNLS